MAEDKKSLENQIKEAELQRIKVETRRIEEERKELERKNTLPWYRRPAFFQALVAGVVAIPLIWFYVKEIAVPLYQSDNIKLKRDIEAATDSLNKREKQHKKEVEKLLVQLGTQQQMKSDFDSIYSILTATNEKLRNQSSRTEDPEQLEKNYRSIKSQLDELKQNIEIIGSQIEQQKQRAIANIPIYLSENTVTDMINRNGYYDKIKNLDGKGIIHQYEVKSLSGKKVVIDHATKLMWQRSGSPDKMTYEEAKKYPDQLNREQFAGFNDWRLPTLEEAMSLLESAEKNGDLYIDPVFDKTQLGI